MKFFRINIIWFCLLLLMLNFSCSSDEEGFNRFANIDLSKYSKNNEVLIKQINRLEVDLFKSKSDSVIANIKKIRNKYGSFFDIFMINIVRTGKPDDTLFVYNLLRYINDPTMQEVSAEIFKKYNDNLDDIRSQLNDAFIRYKYFFKDKIIPSIVTCNSGFNFPIICTDSTLAICLEMYLGKNCIYYQYLQFPRYRTYSMERNYIVADAMKAWLYSEFENEFKTKDLISEMIYNGIIMYILDALLPEIHDTIKFAYTNKQLEWCRRNEANMFAYLIEKKLLYSVKNEDINKLISEGPFTALFSKESPSRTGIWLGREIVRKYMENFPNKNLMDLINEKDAHKIFIASKYKPKK